MTWFLSFPFRIPRFASRKQQDALELLKYLLDGIHEEVKRRHATKAAACALGHQHHHHQQQQQRETSDDASARGDTSPLFFSSIIEQTFGGTTTTASLSYFPRLVSLFFPFFFPPFFPSLVVWLCVCVFLSLVWLCVCFPLFFFACLYLPALSPSTLDCSQLVCLRPLRAFTVLHRAGTLCSSVTCGTCGHVSTVFESFIELSLPLPNECLSRQDKEAMKLYVCFPHAIVCVCTLCARLFCFCGAFPLLPCLLFSLSFLFLFFSFLFFLSSFLYVLSLLSLSRSTFPLAQCSTTFFAATVHARVHAPRGTTRPLVLVPSRLFRH